MGIKNLSKAIRRFAPDAVREVTLDDLAGMRAAVDVAIFMYKFKFVGMDPADGLRQQVGRFRAHGIEPAYFFDGLPCAAKGAEITQRSQAREGFRDALSDEQAKVRALRCKDLSTVTDPLSMIAAAETRLARSRRRVSGKPTRRDYAEARRVLTKLGVRCYQSRNDGEKACAWAVRTGLCDFVASEDFDCVPYDAGLLVTGVGRATMTAYDVAAIRAGFGDWTAEQVVLFCVLLGSDLCATRIRGIGPVRAKALVDSHGTLDALVAHLGATGVAVPEAFPSAARSASLEFLDASPQATPIARPRSPGTARASRGSAASSPDTACAGAPVRERGPSRGSDPSRAGSGSGGTGPGSPRTPPVPEPSFRHECRPAAAAPTCR